MARRFSLREFQQNVLNRIQAGDTSGSRASMLGVQVGEQIWLVQMSDISQVLPLPVLTRVPLTKSWFLGVANIRGVLYSITDLAAFGGQGETPRGQSNRVLLLADKYGFNAGLLVTRVMGLRDSSNWMRVGQGAALRLQDEQGQVWQMLDMAGLVERNEFLQVGV